jgi:hypothetical protein
VADVQAVGSGIEPGVNRSRSLFQPLAQGRVSRLMNKPPPLEIIKESHDIRLWLCQLEELTGLQDRWDLQDAQDDILSILAIL